LRHGGKGEGGKIEVLGKSLLGNVWSIEWQKKGLQRRKKKMAQKEIIRWFEKRCGTRVSVGCVWEQRSVKASQGKKKGKNTREKREGEPGQFGRRKPYIHEGGTGGRTEKGAKLGRK